VINVKFLPVENPLRQPQNRFCPEIGTIPLAGCWNSGGSILVCSILRPDRKNQAESEQRRRKELMTDAGALEALITQQVITAMKAHDAERTGTLRLIKNALKNKAIEKRAALTPAEEQQALATMIKQRRDSIEQFTKGNRPELAAKESAEIVVIEEFLPKALDEGGLRALVAEAIAEHASASGRTPGPKDMGPVIKAVQAKLQQAGVRAEGRVVSEAVKVSLTA
jgi:uncharacterized protein